MSDLWWSTINTKQKLRLVFEKCTRLFYIDYDKLDLIQEIIDLNKYGSPISYMRLDAPELIKKIELHFLGILEDEICLAEIIRFVKEE